MFSTYCHYVWCQGHLFYFDKNTLFSYHSFSFFFSDISFSNKGHSAKELISAIPLDNQSCPVVEWSWASSNLDNAAKLYVHSLLWPYVVILQCCSHNGTPQSTKWLDSLHCESYLRWHNSCTLLYNLRKKRGTFKKRNIKAAAEIDLLQFHIK